MNYFNRKALEKLNLSPEEVEKIRLDTGFFPKSEILAWYKLKSNNEKMVLVNLNDIAGYDTYDNLYQVMDTLFDSNGDEYHSRSVSLFDLTIDDFREKLFPDKNKVSFKIYENRGRKI